MVEVIGEDDPFLSREETEREPGLIGADGRRQADRKAELDGQIEVHVEELGAQRDGGEMWREVGHVDAPRNRPFDLGPTLAQHFFGIGVLPQVTDVAGEPGLSAEQ